jgi:cytochrome o ubiquinol oxidase subunit 2
MNFDAVATSRQAFDAWVREVKKSPDRLDLARYADIQKPGIGYHPEHFSAVEPDLFEHILRKYDKADGLPENAPGKAAPLEER